MPFLFKLTTALSLRPRSGGRRQRARQRGAAPALRDGLREQAEEGAAAEGLVEGRRAHLPLVELDR